MLCNNGKWDSGDLLELQLHPSVRKNYIAVETIDASTVKVTVYNPNSGNVESVEFPTWSETGGQDDIVWYQGTRNRDGSWSATISADKPSGMAESLSLMCMRIIRDKRSESELCPTIWYQVRLQE